MTQNQNECVMNFPGCSLLGKAVVVGLLKKKKLMIIHSESPLVCSTEINPMISDQNKSMAMSHRKNIQNKLRSKM